jgi:hypothetical protein
MMIRHVLRLHDVFEFTISISVKFMPESDRWQITSYMLPVRRITSPESKELNLLFLIS